MIESRLMIVMGERAWTLAALHLACVMARRDQTAVALLRMVAVGHPALLGTDPGLRNFTSKDAHELDDMAATAEDYGVFLDVQLFQYANYWSGVLDAAEQLAATAVIVHVPPSPIPYWQQARRGWLRRRLARQQQLLITLDDMTPSLTWTPSATLLEETAVKLRHHHI
ncbi:MAG: hypothetical protein IPM39_16730 [Chloroflexi bacterium]|nr:hypothetical protein [Chloroflexota bacterium]